MKKLILVFAITASCSLNSIYAQVKDQAIAATSQKDYLKGLRKATKDEQKDQNEKISKAPMYTEDGQKLTGQEMMQAIMSGNYVLEPYVDANKDVKAVVLRAASEEEKARQKEEIKNQTEGSNLVGKQAPAFSVTDMNGTNYSMEELKGKIIVMNFWFVACKPCVMEMPELNKLVEKYKGKDVVFLGFGVDERSKVADFLTKHEFNYHIIPASKEVIKNYKIWSYPTQLIIDKNSIVVHSGSGGSSATVSDLDDKIGSLIK
jgi:peroxiredoxin